MVGVSKSPLPPCLDAGESPEDSRDVSRRHGHVLAQPPERRGPSREVQSATGLFQEGSCRFSSYPCLEGRSTDELRDCLKDGNCPFPSHLMGVRRAEVDAAE
ncbi:Hypothetical predicted protein [Podarcis lilfordi]|uniref:Uncharacterized protein n=1 Tax=Podarcis lilfordi TaxID=74358 RepID=A0AA35LIL2_9SAUR|nr:Hypothetical predicted protein [Podarcis lilfordi]